MYSEPSQTSKIKFFRKVTAEKMFDSAQNKRLFLKNNFLQDIFADPREICLKAAEKFIVIQSRKDLMIWNMLLIFFS